MKYKVWDIMQNPDSLIFFDIDGTLTSNTYGKYHAYLEGDDGYKRIDYYKDCVALLPIKRFIDRHDIRRIYCISTEYGGKEEFKIDFVRRAYGILRENCFFVNDHNDKPDLIKNFVFCAYEDIDPLTVVLVDDNDGVLKKYRDETPFCSAHPMIFMKYAL